MVPLSGSRDQMWTLKHNAGWVSPGASGWALKLCPDCPSGRSGFAETCIDSSLRLSSWMSCCPSPDIDKGAVRAVLSRQIPCWTAQRVIKTQTESRVNQMDHKQRDRWSIKQARRNSEKCLTLVPCDHNNSNLTSISSIYRFWRLICHVKVSIVENENDLCTHFHQLENICV